MFREEELEVPAKVRAYCPIPANLLYALCRAQIASHRDTSPAFSLPLGSRMRKVI